MHIIGLTGSVGMGKSLTATMLRKMGCAVHSADAAVHRALGPGGAAVAAVAALFPQAHLHKAIDRRILGGLVFGQPEKLRQLEAILHPLVRAAEEAKIARARAAGKKAVVLDIPLLFETDGDQRCDTTLCVTAPAAVQRRRVLSRPGMSAEKFAQILAAQLPDAEKCRRADYVIHTGYGRCPVWWQVRGILWRLKIT
ncbi:MAG: dephospho-CoA kinase [Alphaproteobacteria bacterium]